MKNQNRYVMLRGSPGFYSYAVLERLKGWPSFIIQEGRIVFKLHSNKYYLRLKYLILRTLNLMLFLHRLMYLMWS